jgi:hypothetical protein
MGVALLLACDQSTTGPVDQPEGLTFGSSSSSAHSAKGQPAVNNDGSILDSEFAVSRADSVGGFALVSFDPSSDDPSHGNLFVLQAPRQTGTMACGDVTDAAPCHGRYIMGIRDGQTITYDKWYAIKEGSLTVTQIGPDRLKGTFDAILRTEDGEEITVEDGTIDVPYSASQVTDGALRCLIGLAQGSSENCRGIT